MKNLFTLLFLLISVCLNAQNNTAKFDKLLIRDDATINDSLFIEKIHHTNGLSFGKIGVGEQLVLTSSGDFGIDVTPTQKNHINGNSRIDGNIYSERANIGSNSFHYGNTTLEATRSTNGSAFRVTQDNGAAGEGLLVVEISGTERGVNIGRNSGIRFSTDKSPLAINRSTMFGSVIGSQISFSAGASTWGIGIDLFKSGSYDFYTANNTTSFSWGYGSQTTSFTETMTLKNDVGLGIGTTTPSEKLEVVGNSKLDGTVEFQAGLTNIGFTTTTADPTTTEYPNNKDYGIHINTTSGIVYLVFNNSGTIVKIALV